MKLTAVPVPYSSVVGRSILLKDGNGKHLAQLAIMNASNGALTDYKQMSLEVSDAVCEAINKLFTNPN